MSQATGRGWGLNTTQDDTTVMIPMKVVDNEFQIDVFVDTTIQFNLLGYNFFRDHLCCIHLDKAAPWIEISPKTKCSLNIDDSIIRGKVGETVTSIVIDTGCSFDCAIGAA